MIESTHRTADSDFDRGGQRLNGRDAHVRQADDPNVGWDESGCELGCAGDEDQC